MGIAGHDLIEDPRDIGEHTVLGALRIRREVPVPQCIHGGQQPPQIACADLLELPRNRLRRIAVRRLLPAERDTGAGR
ncbi:hypothetical protein [Streptomyces gilvosporeus]|uniref:hypothetical protein n=1 Tax=Streptomyces gilvosporeus TaxID=553510 RepID=UPI0013968A22|nr:hypothetical protein [Streptomyces gilvosporeus]